MDSSGINALAHAFYPLNPFLLSEFRKGQGMKMAKKRNDLWNKAKWMGFVNVRLTSVEKEHVKANLLSIGECFQFLEDMATDGYKVSLSYSPPQDTYTVSLTGVWQGKVNAGMTMSITHKELVVAVTAVEHVAREDGKGYDWTDRFTIAGDNDW